MQMMMPFKILLACLMCVLMLTTPQRVCAKDGDGDQEIMAIATISDINNLLNTISLYTMLEIDVSTNVVFRDKYLIPFGNYLDYQWVGAGKTAYLYPSKIASFIAEKINTGTPPENVARLVINAFQEGLFSVDVGEPDAGDANKLRVGAYFVGGYDIFQNPAGEVETHFEINQSKFYFSGHYNPDKSNRNVIDFLAEFNPVPEEVYHHIDFLRVNHGSYYDTLVRPSDEEGDGFVPFERLQVSVSNLAKSGVNVTFGQIRNPFGIWSDFSSHRNFTSTKNNLLVNGWALKKIELGLQLDRQWGPFHGTFALVSGHPGRTSFRPRESEGRLLDVVLRGTWQHRGLRVGASSYFSDYSTRGAAYGVDVSMEANKFLFGGELVYQRNLDFSKQVDTDGLATRASSMSGYVQVDYALRPKLHLFGLYDIWSVYLDGDMVRHPVAHVFHGVRYYLTPNVRWTPVEFGYLYHNSFDKTRTRFGSQIEVTF
jgi:hypothetical protein